MKNKEWAKNRIKNTLKFEALNDREVGFKVAMKEALEILDQLNEPETLSVDKEQLIKRIENYIPLHDKTVGDVVDGILELVKQLPEMEVLSPEWIDDNKKYNGVHDIGYYVPIGRLHDLLVPKQELPASEEPKYYALIKGHELLKGKGDWVVPTYWCLDTTNGNMFISDRITVLDKFLIEASKSEWNKLGINDSNADFLKVEELEE